VQITENLRSYLFRDVYESNDIPQPPFPGPNSDVVSGSYREVYHGTGIALVATYPRAPVPGGSWHPKVTYS
jgi:hypothetical protein